MTAEERARELKESELAHCTALLSQPVIAFSDVAVLAGYMNRALSELRRRRSLMAWRPIEEAPKDGTRFLSFDNERVTLVSWRPNGKYFADRDTDHMGEVKPTHWMPLPAPPDKEKGGE